MYNVSIVVEAKKRAANRPKPMPLQIPTVPTNEIDVGIKFDSLGFVIKNKSQQEEELKKKLEAEKKKKDEEAKAKKPLDKSRPVSSTPIAGTPW